MDMGMGMLHCKFLHQFYRFQIHKELSFKGHLLPRIRKYFGDLSEDYGWGDLGESGMWLGCW